MQCSILLFLNKKEVRKRATHEKRDLYAPYINYHICDIRKHIWKTYMVHTRTIYVSHIWTRFIDGSPESECQCHWLLKKSVALKIGTNQCPWLFSKVTGPECHSECTHSKTKILFKWDFVPVNPSFSYVGLPLVLLLMVYCEWRRYSLILSRRWGSILGLLVLQSDVLLTGLRCACVSTVVFGYCKELRTPLRL